MRTFGRDVTREDHATQRGAHLEVTVIRDVEDAIRALDDGAYLQAQPRSEDVLDQRGRVDDESA